MIKNPVNMSDHDLLIRVDAKVDNLALDVKDLKDGFSARLVTVENKITQYDKILAEYSPEPIVKQLHENTQWIRDFKTTNRVVIGLFTFLAFLAGILGTIVSTSTGIVNLFNQ